MPKSAIILRNISAVSPSEIWEIISMANFEALSAVDNEAALPVQKLQSRLIKGKPISVELLQQLTVRDYLFDRIREKTGYLVILYQDAEREAGTKRYILNKLTRLGPEKHINLFYLGGGHGGGYEGRVDDQTSGLYKKDVVAIAAQLSREGIHIDVALFGSCYSAAFTPYFRPLLTDSGIMLADVVECSDSCFTQTVRWLMSDNPSFFSAEEIDSFQIKPSDLRTNFNELFRGAEGILELSTQYYLKSYAEMMGDPAISSEEMQANFASDPDLRVSIEESYVRELTEALESYSSAIRSERSLIRIERLREITAAYPLLQSYIDYALKHAVVNSRIDLHIAHLQQCIDDFGDENQPGLNDPIKDELFAFLESKFTTIEGKNFLKLYIKFDELCFASFTYDEFDLSCRHKQLKKYISSLSRSDADLGLGITLIDDEDEPYRNLLTALQPFQVPSKMLSTRTDIYVMRLDKSTGKPFHSHADAYELVSRVIDILSSVDAGIKINSLTNVRDFNQMVVLRTFNTLFKAAVQILEKISPKSLVSSRHRLFDGATGGDIPAAGAGEEDEPSPTA
jgi:hypothetical protein